MYVASLVLGLSIKYNRLLFFFFKQKTAYEMRISDWSSDVCSSDLEPRAEEPHQEPWGGVSEHAPRRTSHWKGLTPCRPGASSSSASYLVSRPALPSPASRAFASSCRGCWKARASRDRKSTRLNYSH